MAGTTEKTIAIAVGVAFLALVMNAAVSYQVTRRLVLNDQLTLRSHEAISELDGILSAIRDAETGQRGYILTGQANDLLPYFGARARADSSLSRATVRLQGDAGSLALLTELRPLVARKLDELDQSLVLWNTGQYPAARALVLTERNRDAMIRIRGIIHTLTAAQRAVLAERATQSADSARVALSAFLIANALAALLLFLTLGVTLGAIMARRRAEASAKSGRALLLAVLTSMDDGVIVSDTEQRVVFMNERAEALTGSPREHAPGRELGEVLRLGRDVPPAGAAPEPPHAGDPGLVLVRPDGTTVAIELSRQQLPVGEDPTYGGGLVHVIRDVTEHRRLEGERARLLAFEQDARTRAETSSREKDEFVAMISHELRTPLNAILGWAHILRVDSRDGPDRLRSIDIIERNAREQAALIDGLLDVSRIVAGKLTVDRDWIDLGVVLEAALDSIRPSAENKGVTLALHREPCETAMSGDANRLRQVFANLVANAIKFTPRGGRVDVTLRRPDDRLEVEVRDTGAGIAPDFLPRIFDRFSQADPAGGRNHGGLGLGLAIARHVVELHQGSIAAASPGLGLGSVFTVTLPTGAGHGPAPRPESAAEGAPARLVGVRLLLVDDDRDSLDALHRLLEQRGADVRVATSAAEALATLETWMPDVLISDIGMPEQDGPALLEKVRSLPDPRAVRLPAIALTAFTSGPERARSLAAGFAVHISKPVGIEELARVVDGLLTRAEGGSLA